MFRALCSVLEQNHVVLAAQPVYAIMMEASLSRVVLAHIHALEKKCLVRLYPLHPAFELLQSWRHILNVNNSTFQLSLLTKNERI